MTKNPAAVALGRLGGNARSKNLSAKRRREIALMGVKARKKLSPKRRSEIAKIASLAAAKKRQQKSK